MSHSARNPWTKLQSTVMYSNPWITVREDKVIRPDGSPGIYGVVETKIATAVVALTPAEDVYLVGQYRYPTEVYSWEVIEGGTEKGESPLEAARRELEEEAGLRARSIVQLGGEVHLSNCFTDERGVIFVATGLSDCPSRPDDTEVLELRKVSFRDALEMVDSGEIVDAMSVIALLRTERALQAGTLSF